MKKIISVFILFFALIFLPPRVVVAQEKTPENPERLRIVVSTLDTVAEGLKPGESVDFLGPPREIGRFGISWQATSSFWDSKRREMHFMAKAQGGGEASHWIYSETEHAWRATTKDLVPGQGGHIWNRTFDVTTGDYFYLDFPTTHTEPPQGCIPEESCSYRSSQIDRGNFQYLS